MSSLGTFVLLGGFVVAAYAAAASVAGARRRSRRLVESGVGAFYMVTALMTMASGIIVHAFVTNNYSIKYVQRYSDAAQPLFYKLASYWGGLDGSILFWVFLLSAFGALAVYTNRERQRELIPYVVAIIAVVEMFFLFLMVIHNNPFETFLTETHADGAGLNPLLQNFYMAIHPPSLYIGFVGMTIPFAFGMAALITGYLDDSWLRAVRRWTMISWFALSFGLVLGMLWAYEELGWGGYWGWDPVENAGLLPWFTATAFLHSVMVQERRGMLRVWNVSLVIVTFFLTIFGTFMTRSGIVQSVHAFGEDRELALMFTVFMVALLVFSFGYVIYRLPLLKSRHELDSWASKEAAFLANNWVLLFSAFFVLFATMFPTLSEAVMNERLTVGPPFFNRWMAPIGLILLFLTGVGPLLAWRKSTVRNMREQFLWPTALAVVVAGALVAAGVRVWSSGVCFALSGFVFGTIAQEFWRGARVRQGATGTDVFTALVGLIGRSRRRYGGYIIHLGIVLIFLGFAGEGFKGEEQVLLKQGQQTELRGFTVKNNGIRVTDDGQKQMVTASLAVLHDGKAIGEMHPARHFYRKREEEPTTEVAIRRGFAEDLYIVLAGYDMQTQSATLEIVVNPLVNWIWFGFAIMAIGTGLALLPESTFAFATANVPAGSVTASMILLGLLLLPGAAGAGGVSATAGAAAESAGAALQHVESAQTVTVVPRSPLEKDLYKSIICMCGTCGRKRVGECTCGLAAEMREEISGLVDKGMTKDQVFQYYIAKYGSQEPLAEPIDKGFNRLAWLFPYVMGLAGLGLVIGTALRWSRKAGQEQPARDASPAVEQETDANLNARLDDELRDLD
ncbi:MAG TPA: cytochrome c-type biogenesis CcmF C-terminal domain-containing protein [Vicinamibacterales bacterium]|nr:cytochrome c-type biogenesis CcmF C-terminal domain-containing protein [Vicinamibacterales bacterium]